VSLRLAATTEGGKSAMAGRGAVKANPKGAATRAGARGGRAKPRKAAAAGAAVTLEERIAVLERERDQLQAALDEERARRRKLEEVYAAARDRISRALDSLHTILNAKG
jgi:chromosome segregation ATPase